MPATIVVPPHYWSQETEIELELTDAYGKPFPAEITDGSGFVAGKKKILVGDTGATFTIPCNDEIPAAPGQDPDSSRWLVSVRRGREISSYSVAISAQSPPTTWAELIGSTGPVDPSDMPRWMPDPSAEADDRWLKTQSGAWITTDAPAGGGGDVTNPMTQDLDVGGFGIISADNGDIQIIANGTGSLNVHSDESIFSGIIKMTNAGPLAWGNVQQTQIVGVNAPGGYLAFRPSDSEAMVVYGQTRNFNVRIGDGRDPIPETKLLVSGAITAKEQSADPADPAEGYFIIWMSDGSESGSDGDILIKRTAGGVTKTFIVNLTEI